jgi:hypothetical protein
MPMKASKAANFCKAGVVVDANFEIRITYALGSVAEFIGEAKHTRIARQLERGEM